MSERLLADVKAGKI